MVGRTRLRGCSSPKSWGSEPSWLQKAFESIFFGNVFFTAPSGPLFFRKSTSSQLRVLRCQPESGSLWCHWSSFGPASSSDHSDQAVHDVHGSYRAQILKQTEMWLKMTETYYAYYTYLCCVPWCHHSWVLHVVPRRHAVLSLHCPDRIHFIAENTASVLLLATRHYQLGLYPANYSEELASKTQNLLESRT